jgi:hypothetical protein
MTGEVEEDVGGRQLVVGCGGAWVKGMWPALANQAVVIQGSSARMRFPIDTNVQVERGATWE